MQHCNQMIIFKKCELIVYRKQDISPVTFKLLSFSIQCIQVIILQQEPPIPKEKIAADKATTIASINLSKCKLLSTLQYL